MGGFGFEETGDRSVRCDPDALFEEKGGISTFKLVQVLTVEEDGRTVSYSSNVRGQTVSVSDSK